MKWPCQLLALCAFAIVLVGLVPTAIASDTIRTERTTTQLAPETTGFVPGETLWFAVHQDIVYPWHVFWINPGDAGLPLALEWSLPDGFEVGDIIHPAPERIPVGPLASFAHIEEAVYLVPVRTPSDLSVGGDIEFSINASWQVCETVCILEEGSFELTLPVLSASEKIATRASWFEVARAGAPLVAPEDAILSKVDGDLILSVPGITPSELNDVFFFPELEGLTEAAAPQIATVEEGGVKVAMTPGYVPAEAGAEIRGLLAIGAPSGEREVYQVTAIADASVATTAPVRVATSAGGLGIGTLLLLAFAGGVILNVMPCVFPIVFVKAASLMAHSHDAGAVRRHGVIYTGGVVFSFLLMGGLLLALRAGGEQLGWGFHLQSPVIVALSAYTLFLVGLNLAGVFHVGESLQGTGAGLAQREGAVGSFATGALAVVVAAPCIGPLLSAPMGAALLQPAIIGILIFLVMALGLAAPYLLLSFAPRIGRFLPKPGAWMETLKQALAFPVFGAAAYFVWVFARQTGSGSLGLLIGGAVFLAFAAWGFQKSKAGGIGALFLRAAAGLAAAIALAPLMRIEPAPVADSSISRYGALKAASFSDEAVEDSLASGQPVFAVFTAAWCVTCQVDKLTIFSNSDVASAMDAENVSVLVADWTVRDEKITAALERFGASGVPFYVYYPVTGAPEALPLPLTQDRLLKIVNLSGQAYADAR